MNGDNASVDSELALLYGDLRGAREVSAVPRRIHSSASEMRNFGTRSFRSIWSRD